MWTWVKYVGRLFVSDATKFIVLVRFAIMTPPALIKLGAGSEYAETLAWLTWPHVAMLTAGLAFLVLIWRAINHGYTLETEREPKITISDPIQDHEPWGQDRSLKAVRRFSIEITNLSTANIGKCAVIEHDFVNVRGRHAPEKMVAISVTDLTGRLTKIHILTLGHLT